MLKTILIAVAFAVAAPAFAQDMPAQPAPYLAGPSDAPGPASIAGTRWQVQMTWEDPSAQGVWTWAEFMPDGTVQYGYPDPDGRTWHDGYWRQHGALLDWDVNATFNAGLGVIGDDGVIRGTMINARGLHGQWTMTRDNSKTL